MLLLLSFMVRCKKKGVYVREGARERDGEQTWIYAMKEVPIKERCSRKIILIIRLNLLVLSNYSSPILCRLVLVLVGAVISDNMNMDLYRGLSDCRALMFLD